MKKIIAILILIFLTSYLPTSAITIVTITTTGAGTWTAPRGVTTIRVECWGGGGGGGTTNSTAAGGGKGGGYGRRNAMTVTPGTTYNYTIAATGLSGTDGQDTTFTGDNSVQCLGAGGKAALGVSSTLGATSTEANIGDVTFQGGNGGDGTATTGPSGGGGGGAGDSANGGDASGMTAGTGGIFGGGLGATGRTTVGSASGGTAPGGGGAGAFKLTGGPTNKGGTSSAGQIRITYTQSMFSLWRAKFTIKNGKITFQAR